HESPSSRAICCSSARPSEGRFIAAKGGRISRMSPDGGTGIGGSATLRSVEAACERLRKLNVAPKPRPVEIAEIAQGGGRERAGDLNRRDRRVHVLPRVATVLDEGGDGRIGRQEPGVAQRNRGADGEKGLWRRRNGAAIGGGALIAAPKIREHEA